MLSLLSRVRCRAFAEMIDLMIRYLVKKFAHQSILKLPRTWTVVAECQSDVWTYTEDIGKKVLLLVKERNVKAYL